VTLAGIEDDARDEELSVVWELEPGAVVHDIAILPSPVDGFDEPSELAAFLHAVRWGAIASADTTALQAPFRSGIQIEDYQLDPVVCALSMPRTNLLIADDRRDHPRPSLLHARPANRQFRRRPRRH